VMEEMNMYLDTPMSYIHDLWEKLLYGDQPAGWMTIGEKETIAKLKRKQVLNYLKIHCKAENSADFILPAISSPNGSQFIILTGKIRLQ